MAGLPFLSFFARFKSKVTSSVTLLDCQYLHFIFSTYLYMLLSVNHDDMIRQGLIPGHKGEKSPTWIR